MTTVTNIYFRDWVTSFIMPFIARQQKEKVFVHHHDVLTLMDSKTHEEQAFSVC